MGKDGKITEEIRDKYRGCAQTIDFKKLAQKGVVVSLNETVPRGVQSQLRFTFSFKDESYQVQIFMKTTLLKEFVITRRDIQLMQAGRKNDVYSVPLTAGEEGDSKKTFMTMNCFRLRRLLAWINAE